MISVVSTNATSSVGMIPGQPDSAGSASGTTDLLPNPSALDPMTLLYLYESKSRADGFKQATKDVKRARDLRKAEIKKQMEALRKAAKEKKKGGFWKKVRNKCSKIAKYAAVASAVALAVGTCGAGTPGALAIVGVALSAGSMAQSEWGVLQKMGMSDEWAARCEIGMAVGGAVCMGFGAPGGASQLEETISTGDQICSAAGGAATVTAGAATIAEGKHESKARDLEADAADAAAEAEAFKRLLNQIIDDLETSDRAEERVLGHIRQAITTQGTGMQSVAMRV